MIRDRFVISDRAMAEALQVLRRDPEQAERLGRNAKMHLRARHAWPALAGETLELVERILKTQADQRATAL